MTLGRAAEILDPDHRECYDSIETVNEACLMGMKALKKRIAQTPIETTHGYRCRSCDIDLFEADSYCYNCGQALDWSVLYD